MDCKWLKMQGLVSCFALLIGAAAALPAQAGVYYQAVTRDDASRGEVVVHGWVDGDKAKIEFEQTGKGQGPMTAGTYLLTQDGGETLYLVNPKEKTYSRWDLEAMLATAGAVMESMGSMMSFDISDPQIEELAQGDGGTVAGLPTTYAKYRTTYSMEMKILGMKRSNQVEMVQEIWATDAVVDPGFGVWLRKGRPTGNESLDRLIKAEMSKVHGFPLKTVTVTTTTGGKKGKQNTTRSETVVTELDRDRSIPASTFEIPAGYEETQMLPAAGEGEGQEGGNPFKGLFKGGKG